MKSYKFTYELQVVAKTKKEAMLHFQLAIDEDIKRSILKIGKIKEIRRK